MNDLRKTWDIAQVSFTHADLIALVKAGVPSQNVTTLLASSSIGACDIKVTGNRWSRNFQGERAVIVPIIGPDSEDVLDLLAFRPDIPLSFWTYDSPAPLLGYDALCRAQHFGKPLFVYRSPLEWLRGAGEGIVILEWKHYWPAYFGGIPALRTDNVGFGRRLANMLKAPLDIPEIQVAAI